MLRFCPSCGSASVEFSELAGGLGKCQACNWKGSVEDMPVMPTGEIDGDVVDRMISDLKIGMSKSLGTFFISYLLKWGFLECDLSQISTIDKKLVARYFAAIARGILKSVMEERTAIEREEIQIQQRRQYGI